MITAIHVRLLKRVLKLLEAQARDIEASETPWSDSSESKAAKRTVDRIYREMRDLNDLIVQMKADIGPDAASKVDQ